MKLSIATLWLNNTNRVPKKEEVLLVKKFLAYMKKYVPTAQLTLYVHLDMGLFARFFDDEIQVRNITDICPDSQKGIYQEGNNIYTMVDHAKHLIVSEMLMNEKGRCVVMDIDISQEQTGLKPNEYCSISLKKHKIRDNGGENQFYVFEGGDSKTYTKHREYYVDTLGKQYAEYASKGMLVVDLKKILMGTYLTGVSNPKKDEVFFELVSRLYLGEYEILFGEKLTTLNSEQFERLQDVAASMYIPSTTLNYFYTGDPDGYYSTEKLELPFEQTGFSEYGMDDKEVVIADLLSLVSP